MPWTDERRTYYSWAAMKARCQNPNNSRFHYYGGRGIRVCERWQSFANFFEDMGRRPEGQTLGRIDNDGHYEPGNCRWETAAQQVRNVRRNDKFGEACHLHRLTAAQVREMRAAMESGEGNVPLAIVYGVTRKQVENIRHRRAWAHI